jgi:hypothetical protein
MADGGITKEQLDRELRELNEELRVMIPGVQILAALLFTVAFTPVFKEFSSLEKKLYYLGFLSSNVATLLLLAPGVQHRMLWREPKKEAILRTATILARIASVVIGIGILSTAYLVGEFVYDGAVAGWSLAMLGGLILVLWFALPLWFRLGVGADRTDESQRGPARKPAA